jgi:hypothetical protein
VIVPAVMAPADNITTALGRKASEPLSPATSGANPWHEMEQNMQTASSLTDELARRQQLPQVGRRCADRQYITDLSDVAVKRSSMTVLVPQGPATPVSAE